MHLQVTSVLKSEILENRLMRPESPPPDPLLIWGLHDLVKAASASSSSTQQQQQLLEGLFEEFFPKWVGQLHSRVMASKKVSQMYADNKMFDAVVALLSEAIKGV